MSSESEDPRSVLLNQVIADYLATVEPGNAPDREKLVRQHPELADDLRLFSADHDRMQAAGESIAVPHASAESYGFGGGDVAQFVRRRGYDASVATTGDGRCEQAESAGRPLRLKSKE